jgi:cytochrome c peroxidase
MGSSQLGAKLSDEEVGKIEVFLAALTGDQPKVALPIRSAKGTEEVSST